MDTETSAFKGKPPTPPLVGLAMEDDDNRLPLLRLVKSLRGVGMGLQEAIRTVREKQEMTPET